MKEIRKSLMLVGGLLLLALAGASWNGSSIETDALGASPVGVPDYEILVTLDVKELDRFDHRIPLTRREYNDARFDPKVAKNKAIKAAKKKLSQRRGYFQQLYGEEASRLESIKVLEVLLVDNRARKRISILRQTAI